MDREPYEGSGKDIISELPDAMISSIISLLPTREAIRTSILSSQWRNAWAESGNLKFYPKNGDSADDEDLGYMEFIEKIISTHMGSVDTFLIECNSTIGVSQLSARIEAMIDRNVKNISVFRPYYPGGVYDLRLPKCFFTCKTLVTLKLSEFLNLDVPDSIHFPSLKVFHLSIEDPNNVLTQKLFCSSPLLEELDVHVTEDSGNLVYKISSPCLKKLHLSISPFDVRNFKSVVNIETPVLESLKVVHVGCPRYNLKVVHNCLVTADVSLNVSMYHDYDIGAYLEVDALVENIVRLLNSISTVKHLNLQGQLTMAVFGSHHNIKLNKDYRKRAFI